MLFKGFDSVKTVRPVKLNSLSLFSMNDQNQLISLRPENTNTYQHGQVYFRSYGLFSGARLDSCQPHGIYLHRLTEPIGQIDIDTYEDLFLAEEVINQDLFDFDLK